MTYTWLLLPALGPMRGWRRWLWSGRSLPSGRMTAQSLPGLPTELASVSVSARHVQPPGTMLWPATAAPPGESGPLGWGAPRTGQDPRPQPRGGAGKKSGPIPAGAFCPLGALQMVRVGISYSCCICGSCSFSTQLPTPAGQELPRGCRRDRGIQRVPPSAHPLPHSLPNGHPWVQD